MLHEPDIYAKMQAELDPFMESVKDDIMTKMNLESVENMDYVKMVYLETMRRDPPGEFSKGGTVTKKTTIGGVELDFNDMLVVGIYFIARDSDYWHDPDAFIPERFDPSSKYYKAPSGKSATLLPSHLSLADRGSALVRHSLK